MGKPAGSVLWAPGQRGGHFQVPGDLSSDGRGLENIVFKETMEK